MEITWYGHSCFRLTHRGMASVVTDPYDHKKIGYSELKLKADIVTISHAAPGHNYVDAVDGSKWQITGPGEYEIGGVFLTAVANSSNGKKGHAAEDLNMTYVYEFEGVTVAHLGDMKKVPSRKAVEDLGKVDILLVPVGGGGSLNAAKAAEVINLIEPGIVIPMHYATDKAKLELSSLEGFFKQMGISNEPEVQEILKVTPRDIPEDTRVVVLKPA